MPLTYGYLTSPAKTRKNLLTSSLPRTWTPHSHENKAIRIADVNGKGSSSSPPPTPTLSEPLEKRSHIDTGEIYTDGDEEAPSSSTDNNKLGVIQHGPSINSIISMEDDDFASDDEKVQFCLFFIAAA